MLISVSSRTVPPLLQAALVTAMGLVALAIASASYIGEDDCWYVASTTVLLFAAGNPVLGIFASQWKKYLIHSVPAFAAVVLIIVAAAHLAAEKSLNEVAAVKYVLIAEIVFFFLINLLVGVFRFIVKMLQESE